MMAGGGADYEAAGGPARHIPVLLPETLEALRPREGGVYIDGTFGAGGYTRAVLESSRSVVLAIDQDPDAIAAGRALEHAFGPRLMLRQGRFADLEAIAAEAGFSAVDGVALDIGVSSGQLDRAERGFSFLRDGPLDMRMRQAGSSAADFVNALSEAELSEIFRVLGEERRARAIARAIVAAREMEPIARTAQLAEIVARVLGRRHDDPKHPATRTFQALRLFVNDELLELARGLAAAERLLKAGGRLIVVTFHSLEDRIAKRFFAERSRAVPQGSRHRPERSAGADPSFRMIQRGAVAPGAGEISRNPRARSAKLRWAERTAAPPHALDLAGLGIAELTASLS